MKYRLAALATMALGAFALFPHASLAAQVSVSAADDFFSPRMITVNQGDTVVWQNNGMMQHTVTADNGSFDSGTMSPGQSFSRTFTTPGTYPYYCRFHGAQGGVGMSGVIIVTASSPPPSLPSPQPNPNPSPNPQPYPQPNYQPPLQQQLYWCGSYYSYYPCPQYTNYRNYNYYYNYPYDYYPHYFSYPYQQTYYYPSLYYSYDYTPLPYYDSYEYDPYWD